MEEIFNQLKELKNNKDVICKDIYSCSKCALSKVLKEIYYDADYEEITICDLLNLIN